jgi:short-subunit dehydrogenase
MKRNSILLSSAVVAAGVGTALWRKSHTMDLRNKVVLITGGSKGLGIAMARKFAEEGSRLVLCARSAEELDRARQDLSAIATEVHTEQCDVGDRDQVEQLVEDTLRREGRIDVLVNNAGVIQVGPVETMEVEQFEEAMDVMFWGMVYSTMAVLPHMRERRSGRIVNITSIGAKVSVPHLTPYSCAKSAAAAFSEGMRAELHGTGIKVVTIAPGLMRTGSFFNAKFNGAEEGEAAWFSVSSSIPGLTMGAARAAGKIVEATQTGRAELILGAPTKLLAGFRALFPGTTADLLGLVNQLLPRSSSRTKKGVDTVALRRPLLRVLTAPGRASAREFLQPRPEGA